MYNTAASLLQNIRKASSLPLPDVLASAPNLVYENHEALGAVADHEDIKKAFPSTYGRARISLQPASSAPVTALKPLRVGVVLSGGQAPGGHNVIAGIYDYLKKVSKDSVIIGFADGPQGIYNNQYCVIDDAMMDNYRNSGGFDMIGSGRHKIEKPAEFAASMKTCVDLNLDGVIVIGGDDSNTNAAVLAEYFEANGCKTKVCGAPKTIDGDLKVDPYIPVSFGFDTACRSYSELIGNLGQDTLSSQKYYHFVRLMGRAASNIALECALWTRPNVCLISEEVQDKKLTLAQITREVVDVIVKRAQQGKNYGLVLLPEGLIEFIPEFNALIADINDVLATGVETTEAAVRPKLSAENQAVFDYLPEIIKQQLLLDRDPHGNVQVAKIETERLLAQTVSKELEKLKTQGEYRGAFSPQFHSYGYEGRSCLPSVFDATYCYILGQTAGAMISLGLNGLISSVTNLAAPVEQWKCGGVPITMMCHMEKRHGHMKPVIKKALVELDGEPFKCFAAQRDDWAVYDFYRSPGPIQFFPESSIVNLGITLTLELCKSDARMSVEALKAAKAHQDQLVQKKYGSLLHLALKSQAVPGVFSDTQKLRLGFKATVAPAFQSASTQALAAGPSQSKYRSERSTVSASFPNTYGATIYSLAASDAGASKAALKIGVAFVGRQAPGGHDVVSGLYDALGAGSTLIGFVGGSVGLVSNQSVVLTGDVIDSYRGQGGLELLSRSAERIDASAHASILHTVTALKLDGLVLVGGSRTNTDAAYLAEYFRTQGSAASVVTVPVDIANSIKSEFVSTAVGFDTATKLAGQVVGNNATDGASAKKYYYFMRLMGDEPSHSTLEVALATKPNYFILAEEVESRRLSLADVVRSIADVVQARAAKGKNYGTVLIPEGIVDSIPELKNLISEIDAVFVSSGHVDVSHVRPHLTLWSRAVLDSLPDFMQAALMLARGTDNSIPISQVETERLLYTLVEHELAARKKKGLYKGSFSVVASFIGYQARGAAPSNFDVTYAYNLGFAATAIVRAKLCGYLAVINNLKGPVSSWIPGAVPITALMAVDPATGRAIVPKAQVDLNGPAYAAAASIKADCALEDIYENPGPLQFDGPAALTYSVPHTLQLESFDYSSRVLSVQSSLNAIEQACRPGCSATLLSVVAKNLSALSEIVELLESDSKRPRNA